MGVSEVVMKFKVVLVVALVLIISAIAAVTISLSSSAAEIQEGEMHVVRQASTTNRITTPVFDPVEIATQKLT